MRRSQNLGVDTDGHHLPAPVARLVGRTATREYLLPVLRDNRLVTLVGAPGVGKSRLALEVARDAVAFVERSWWVDVGSVGDAEGVVGAIARSLGLQEQSGVPLGDALLTKLRGRDVLIVLDNCEHLVEACAATVQTLLARSDGIRVLATSRAPLGIGGEQRWEVPTCSVPGDGANPEAVLASEAGQLFVERAAAVDPQFVLDAATAPAVVAVCRRLDGIALAIELAAAWAPTLSPVEIARFLEGRLDLLRNDQATIPARHETLFDAIEWSYELLSAPEQVLLRRLAVFLGGATLAAVEAVCADADMAPADVPELLTRLVSKSLVVVTATGSAPARYALLRTVRVYAMGRLSMPAKTSSSTADMHSGS